MCIEPFVATAVHVVDLNEGSETSGRSVNFQIIAIAGCRLSVES